MAEVKLNDLPEEVRTLYSKGLEAMERGNLDYAMDLFESAVHTAPACLEARKLLRDAAFKKQASSPAERISGLKQAMSLFILSGQLKKNPLKALQNTESLLRTDPLNLKISKIYCDAAIACNMPEAAMLTLELLNEHLPDNLAILEPLAELSKSAERYDQEYEYRDRIATIKPGNTQAQKLLKDAAARLTMGKSGWQDAERFRDVSKNESVSNAPDSSLNTAEQKVKAEPDNPKLRLALAERYLQKKSYESALATLTEFKDLHHASDPELERKIQKTKELCLTDQLATAEDRDDTALVAKIRLEQSELRISSAAALVERYPTDLQLKYDYGKLLFEQGKFTEAIEQLQQARNNPERRSRSNVYIAKAFLHKNQLNLAMEHFELALQDLSSMNAARKEVLYELGLLCEQRGDKPNAVKYFTGIYAADIAYKDVAQRVEQT